MRILGIDYGDSRIGVAVSDPMGWTAQAVETIRNEVSILNKAVGRITEIIREYNVEIVVVGFPKNMNGTEGPMAEKTKKFISKLTVVLETEKVKGIRIIKWDERLSSVAANRTMTEIGVRTSRKKGIVDQVAAAHILQGYLDSLR